jgi:aminoacrylate hydrolase
MELLNSESKARENMPNVDTQGISLHYEIYGDASKPPVLLVTGLGGYGKSWGAQIDHFSQQYRVVVPDHRGVGQSTHTLDGHTTEQLATDMASLVDHLALGPMHIVGASTGGAIAQYMALNHASSVSTLTLSSTFARFDAFARREFEVRRKITAEWDPPELYAASVLFLLSPRYTREQPEKVSAWIDRAAASFGGPQDREIAVKRIDMIIAHDALSRLGEIKKPTLVICGDHNLCTPLPLSEELASAIPGAELEVLQDAGELIDIEKEHDFFRLVSSFIDQHI